MSSDRVSLFVSHKVSTHKTAAERIKSTLEARAERLTVHICEHVVAGDPWRSWISNRICESNLMLVLAPRDASEMAWIAQEIGMFRASCPKGRLVALIRPGERVPDILSDIQAIGTDRLAPGFLKPLFCDPAFTGTAAPLNARVGEAELSRDVRLIEDALDGIVDPVSRSYAESLVVDVTGRLIGAANDLRDARVSAPEGCVRILNWADRKFRWKDLRERAEEDVGKGTFWVGEMEQVILDVLRQKYPRIMSSTFRGRGQAAGQIFRPCLDRVDFAGEIPLRFRFVFHEVLAPELVRGRDEIGEVFSLLYLATRVRWEVLNPFLIRRVLARVNGSPEQISREMRDELSAQVARSLRVIDLEAERHDMMHCDRLVRLDEGDADCVQQFLAERLSIQTAIQAAVNAGDFERLVEELKRALLLNCRVTEVLAVRYRQLVLEDRLRVEELLGPQTKKRPRMRRAKARTA